MLWDPSLPGPWQSPKQAEIVYTPKIQTAMKGAQIYRNVC